MESKILDLIKQPLLDIGITVDSIIYEKENNVQHLKIFISKEPYIDIDECVKATNIINPIIDKNNIIDESYILDVCSKEKGER